VTNLTSEMTWAAACWLRYTKDCEFVCTELGYTYIKDVAGFFLNYNGELKELWEIEIKNSLSDLRRDFSHKQLKHKNYARGVKCPNKMFYVVPESIGEKAKIIINEQNKRYGVMVFNAEVYLSKHHPYSIGDCLRSISPCRKLTDNKPSAAHFYTGARRLQNEYFMLRYLLEKNTSFLDHIKHYAKERKE